MEGWALLQEKKGSAGMQALVQELNAKIDQKVSKEISGQNRRLIVYRTSWIAAAASIILLLGWYFMDHTEVKPPQEQIAQSLAAPMDTTSPVKDSLVKQGLQETKVKFVPPTVVSDCVIADYSTNVLAQEDLAVEVPPMVEQNTRVLGYSVPDVKEKTIAESAGAPAEMKKLKMEKAIVGKSANASEDSSPVFTVVEEMPTFPGGQDSINAFLMRNIHYPKAAREASISGTVFIGFVVDSRGRIGHVRVLRGIGGGCDEEAVRVISIMPDWFPGKQAGKACSVRCTLPIKFTMAD